MYGPYNHGWMFDGGGAGMLFGVLWMVLFLVIAIALLAALLKYLLGKSRGGQVAAPDEPPLQTPLDVLKAAYARGEIGREEFLQKRDDILEK